MLIQPIEETADEIIALYTEHGHDIYFGEHVTQLQHALQASEKAEKEGFETDIQLAAFLHDIGHICVEITDNNAMEQLGVMNHEAIGAAFLHARGFSERVCCLVAGHVAAKRYLTYINPTYYANLSEASKSTLEFQGGRMSAAEASRFEEDPLFNLYIRMRLWDEAAKEPHLPQGDWANEMKISLVQNCPSTTGNALSEGFHHLKSVAV